MKNALKSFETFTNVTLSLFKWKVTELYLVDIAVFSKKVRVT